MGDGLDFEGWIMVLAWVGAVVYGLIRLVVRRMTDG
jgi:hypothetical protein